MKSKCAEKTVVGIDLGDESHAICALERGGEGEILVERTLTNHRESFRRLSQKYPGALIVNEVSSPVAESPPTVPRGRRSLPIGNFIPVFPARLRSWTAVPLLVLLETSPSSPPFTRGRSPFSIPCSINSPPPCATKVAFRADFSSPTPLRFRPFPSSGNPGGAPRRWPFPQILFPSGWPRVTPITKA